MVNQPKIPPPQSPQSFDGLLGSPEVRKLALPGPYADCLDKIIPHFLFPDELQRLLTDSDTTEAQTRKLALAFHRYTDDYAKFLAVMRKTRDEANLNEDSAIRAYGLDATRIFIYAIALNQSVFGKPFKWEPKTGKPSVAPEKILPFCVEAQQVYSGREVNLAFAAGLAFDILSLVAKKHSPTPRAASDAISALFKRGVARARIGVALGRKVRDLTQSNYVFSVCLLTGLGEAVHAIFSPEYAKFATHAAKDDLPASVRSLCEERLFGISSNRLAALVCEFFPIFHRFADAIRYQRSPGLAESVGKDTRNLAAICCLANYAQSRPLELSGDFEEADDEALVRDRWLRPEVGCLELDPKAAFSAVEELKGAGGAGE